VFCQILGMLIPFVGACWGHAMSKCCQFAIDDTKVCVGLVLISIKLAQSILQKTIISTPKNGKGWQEWHKVWPRCGGVSMEIEDSNEYSICSKNHPILKDF
jgi:hypothetical protein